MISTSETTPVAADLGFALSKRRREEGGFPGAARIMLEREQGPILKRVGLIVEGRQPVREGALVLDADGSEVGRVTERRLLAHLGKPIAMAYVPLAHGRARHHASPSAARQAASPAPSRRCRSSPTVIIRKGA